ncbi:MAG: dTDP-4-dehydrorhamnose 3,5-epimerase [Nitrospinaceae bacterium]|jgi:dTDP-4-dehydrorhamnose 3,5-epimerase|nr:dTDP-4-dehydrorhamnose 3,5-epimerase [Nitrospinaceae bacterium]|tara:strand:+ start:2223 stop:2750 length:528 start_codon:yes stop_codon:yes gene_type:complete
MKVSKAPLDGVLIVEPKIFKDPRGMFYEVYSAKRYAEHGITAHFVQDNHSVSEKGVVRGLHYQVNPGQAKLVRVTRGEVFDVVVDIRKESSTYGKWWGLRLSETNNLQLYIPVGFAHGFCVLSETVEFLYKCSDYYSPENERGILWNDPDLAIDWPVENPTLSEKDKVYPRLNEI